MANCSKQENELRKKETDFAMTKQQKAYCSVRL